MNLKSCDCVCNISGVKNALLFLQKQVFRHFTEKFVCVVAWENPSSSGFPEHALYLNQNESVSFLKSA